MLKKMAAQTSRPTYNPKAQTTVKTEETNNWVDPSANPVPPIVSLKKSLTELFVAF